MKPEQPPVPAYARRRRSFEEKFMIVEETLVPGASVAGVARRHGVNANQVFAWRRECRLGIPDHVRARHGMPSKDFINIGVLENPRAVPAVRSSAKQPEPTSSRRAAPPPSRKAGHEVWLVEVELPNGILVRLGSGFDEKDMRRALVIARDLA